MTADPQYLAAVEARANAAEPYTRDCGCPTCLSQADVPRLVALVREAEASMERMLATRPVAGAAFDAVIAERDAARAALAGIVADLRALCDGNVGATWRVKVRALADQYDGGEDR